MRTSHIVKPVGSRRQFLLGIVSTALAAPVLAACASTPAPAVTAAPTAKPAQPATAPTAKPAQSASAPTTAPAAQPAAVAKGNRTLTFAMYVYSDWLAKAEKVANLWAQQNPGVTLSFQFTGNADFFTKMVSEIATGTPPDVSIGAQSLIMSWETSNPNALLPLDDYIHQDTFSLTQFLAQGPPQYRWKKGDFTVGGAGGQMYGLPGDAQGFIFVYNKTMFDKAGVSYPTDDWTWDDVVTAGQKLTQSDKNEWGCYAPDLDTLDRGNFVYSAGGGIVSSDFKKSELDTPATVSAYKWAWDLIYTHKIAPKPVPNETANPFSSGRVAMYWEGDWFIDDFSKITTFDWDMAQLPKNPTTGKRTTSLESDGWWAYKATKEPELAWSLVKFLAGPPGETQFAGLDFFIPPCIPDIAKTWYAQKPPVHRSLALDNIEQDSKMLSFAYYDAAAVRQAYDAVLQKAFFDGNDIEAIMKEAAAAMNQALTDAWKRFEQS